MSYITIHFVVLFVSGLIATFLVEHPMLRLLAALFMVCFSCSIFGNIIATLFVVLFVSGLFATFLVVLFVSGILAAIFLVLIWAWVEDMASANVLFNKFMWVLRRCGDSLWAPVSSLMGARFVQARALACGRECETIDLLSAYLQVRLGGTAEPR